MMFGRLDVAVHQAIRVQVFRNAEASLRPMAMHPARVAMTFIQIRPERVRRVMADEDRRWKREEGWEMAGGRRYLPSSILHSRRADSPQPPVPIT